MRNVGNNILIALIPLFTVSFVAHLAPYIYIPSLPDMAVDFGVDNSDAAGTMSVYYLALSVTLLLVGTVGDRWDKRRLLASASVMIFAGAVVAAFSPHFGLSLLGWALQGCGAAIITIVGQTWIGQTSDRGNITALFSYMTILLSFAPLIAPVLGGVVTMGLSWRYNFYIVGALALAASLFIRRATPPPPVRQDLPLSPREVVSGYSRLLLRSRFVPLIATSLVCFLFQGALMNYSSFLFIGQLGLTPLTYGLISVPVVAGIIIGQFPVVYIEKRRGILAVHRFNSLVAVGALLLSLAMYALTGTHTVAGLAVVIFIFSIGFGGHTLLALRNVMTAFADRRSHSSALVNFLNQFAGYVASVMVQVAFLFIDSALVVHNGISLLSIILIIATSVLFRKAYAETPQVEGEAMLTPD